MEVYAYRYRVSVGTFSIVRVGDRWEIRFRDEPLGQYHSAESALDDLVGGHCYWPSDGFDPAAVGLPEELTEWEALKRR